MGQVAIPVENIVRWSKWQVLQTGAWIQPVLEARVKEFILNAVDFAFHDKVYFGCGPDGLQRKYEDYDLCDLRNMGSRVMDYDIRLGFPVSDGHYRRVRSKLSWGMFTFGEAEWLMWEVSRVLEPYGIFELSVRTLAHQYDRWIGKEIDDQRLMMFVYGCSQGQYHGSFRKSGWTFSMLRKLANRYGFKNIDTQWRSANVTLKLERTNAEYLPFPEKLEPKLKEDESGAVLNIGGGDYRSDSWKE